MRFRSHLPSDADPFALDHTTADRMVDGTVLPVDSPPEYREVATLLQATRRAPILAREEETVAAFCSVVRMTQEPNRRKPVLIKKFATKFAAASAGVLLTGTMAAASTGLVSSSQDAETTTTTVLEETTTTTVLDDMTTTTDPTTTTLVEEPTTTTTTVEGTVPSTTIAAHPTKQECDAARAVPGSRGCSAVAHKYAPGQVKKAGAHPGKASKGQEEHHTVGASEARSAKRL